MKIFITGGTGFIGSHVVTELIRRKKHRVLMLSTEPVRRPGVEVVRGNLADAKSWKGKLKKFKPEATIHLAWEGIPDFSYAQSAKNLEYGVGLFNVLADVSCKKIVVAGTGFECGNHVGKIEDDINVPPTTAFTAAKHSLHLMGQELAKERGMDFVWLRPFTPYGYGQRAGSLIPFIMKCVGEKTPLTLRGPLAQGDFIYITDVARAFASTVEKGRGIVTYNLGSGYLTPVREIARMICEAMGMDKKYYQDFARTAKGKLTNAAYANLHKIQKDIGWRPMVDMKTGIQKTIKEHKSR
jgi:nucleoside-diphosphate-sugar epimerase